MTVLYSRLGSDSVQAGETTYEPDEEGAFDLPDDLAATLHSLHVAGDPAWENQHERAERLAAEKLARRRDPEALLDAVEHLTTTKPTVAELRAQLAEAEAAENPKPTRKPAAKK